MSIRPSDVDNASDRDFPPVHSYADEQLAQVIPINGRFKGKPNGYAAAADTSSRWDSPPLSDVEPDAGQMPPFEPIDPGISSVETGGINLADFQAYMPMHQYIFVPNRDLWPAASVNARLPKVDVGTDKPMKPSDWLDANQPVEQMTWSPGQPTIIENCLISNGGEIRRDGTRTFNLYIPPSITLGTAALAGPWLEHLGRVYPDDCGHILKWCAQRVQRPGQKINHALVLGGSPGIGKDTALEPVAQAVGPWNVQEVSPSNLLGRFNPWVKSVILRVSEARDLGDVNRYGFYEHMKVYTAAPPDVLRCDEKNLREHAVVNVCGVILTTNHKNDGVYLPPDDRRHYVAWSAATKDDFASDYFSNLYAWYAAGGFGHVAAYLTEFDLTSFDPKAPPPKTAAFWEIVDANRAPEDAELADVLDIIRNPPAFTLSDLQHPLANADFRMWLSDKRNRRAIPHRLESVGYVAVRNEATLNGLWVINGTRQTIYALKSLTTRERFKAAGELYRFDRSKQ